MAAATPKSDSSTIDQTCASAAAVGSELTEMRVSPGDEEAGLDLSEHAEVAYHLPEAMVDMTSDSME
jgi:hypothetical protein